jgi:hypothetical protein
MPNSRIASTRRNGRHPIAGAAVANTAAGARVHQPRAVAARDDGRVADAPLGSAAAR